MAMPWLPLRRGSRQVDPIAVLALARRIAGDLAGGLSGPGGPSAARHIRRLLGVRAAGLADLSGEIIWAGHPSDATEAGDLVSEVLHTETGAGRPPLLAVPLDVDDEVAGVLVVDGQTDQSAVREVAWLVAHGLARGKLDASAEQAARSELRALRAEISPHFVYNALTVIAALVKSEPDRSRELMLDFADYNRYSLAHHGEYTTVAEEFHAIETYLTLQRAVLGDRLRVQIRVAPDVLAVPLPYLVLQPLVENAIRHGIEPRGEGGTVQVHGEAQGSDCVISIEDDGVGMDPVWAETVLAGKGVAGSVGLTNVDKRLRTVYGSWHGLVVETAPGAGTRVLVRVPRFQPGVMPS
ncbi:histidine kinase [Nocardia vinacea]|uniref:Histidine kinase n=1 Tax=Nocardia vinacea TaxID=96468 RepID=A0ABZ1YP26_9NOCA|nr:histidine kinase [Nocardia vinacea]